MKKRNPKRRERKNNPTKVTIKNETKKRRVNFSLPLTEF